MAIFTAIAGAIAGALFTAGTVAFGIASSLIAGALSFGARLLINYLFRPKARKYTAIQGEVQYGADVPCGTVYGTCAVRGHRLFYAKWGSGNKYNSDVFVLANGWCDGLEPEVYFYGKKHVLKPIAIIGNEAAHYQTDEFGSKLKFRFYDGRPGQLADARLVQVSGSASRSWKATSRCTGLCYVVVERTYSEDFDQGIPEFTFVLRGLRLYDPRKDSTVVGGSGTHRVDDPATWEHSLNPAVQRLNYQLGLRGMISQRTIIGEGKTMGQLDLATYVAAMNVCDTVRSNGKKTYESSIFVMAEDDHTEILKEWDDAMAGYGLNRRGLSGVIAGAPQVPVRTITADDIPVDRSQQVGLRKSAFDMINYLSGQYTSKEAMWGAESLKPITVNADVASDGRPRQAANDFLQVTDPDIAQYLLTMRYRQNRHSGQATVPVSRRAGLAVQEGEWVEFLGKDWLITEWQCDEDFRFTLQLSETSADIYEDAGIVPGPVVVPSTPPVNPDLVTSVSGFAAVAGFLTGETGLDTPVLRFSWVPPDDPTITQVRFEYRVVGNAEISRDVSLAPEEGEHITSNGIAMGSSYEARATITTVPDRPKQWTPWVLATGTTGEISTDILDNSITQAKLADAAVGADQLMQNAVTQDKIAANAVSADKIAANSIVARHLTLVDFTNLVPDNQFKDTTAWTTPSPWSLSAAENILTWGSALRLLYTHAGGTGYTSPARSSRFVVEPGRAYAFSWLQHRYGTVGNVLGRVFWYKADGTISSVAPGGYTDLRLSAAGQMEIAAGAAVAPSDAFMAELVWYIQRTGTTGNIGIGKPMVRVRANAELIVDGSVTAEKMNVTDLSAISANLGTIKVDGAHIENLTVDTIHMQYYAINDLVDVTRSNFGVSANGFWSTYMTETLYIPANSIIFEVSVFIDKSTGNYSYNRLLLDGVAQENTTGSNEVKDVVANIDYRLQVPSEGEHTLELQHQNWGGVAGTYQFDYVRLVALVTKK